MENRSRFIQQMQNGGVCLGTCITFSDATITEALSPALDFAWIEMEHNPLSLEAVQAHIIATKGTSCTPLVRVAWNDPVLIKPVLDIGAAGIIVPMVRTAAEAQRAVEACLYPPAGIRGFGPRRPSNYGRIGGPEFCRDANESIIVIPQLEHIDAVKNIDSIVKVPGVSALVIGPNDLSGSIGLLGQARHPDVVAAIDTIIEAGVRAKLPVGLGAGAGYEDVTRWIAKGAQWIAVAADYIFITQAVDQLFCRLRAAQSSSAAGH
jgi:2-dehydro-3-deoxyglucarate aldolase/4-hydroxy-2-oxoheptanedioate aldolase